MRALKLAVVQFTPQFGKIRRNLNRNADLVSDADVDLIVYSELCTSGYLFETRDELESLAEKADGASFDFLRQRARNKSFNPFNHILNDRKPRHYSPLTDRPDIS